ncbi:MAG TPA: ArsR family transcriptional regulator [Candidatus Thermoplasmatota archaeon]|nr:ArsR family transcriptional regulator [Candidatus Thermoplasmatota archaeon]
MRRIKVVSEPTDLVPILRAFDSDVKRNVFRRLVDGWLTPSAVEKEFGPEGAEALRFFEKTKLVETRWEPAQPGMPPEKGFHSYYTSVQVNTQCMVQDLAELFAVAAMNSEAFERIEADLDGMVTEEGASQRAVLEKFGWPQVRLKAILKRSTKFEMRGQLVRRI